jgi:hypothetical protein
MTAKTAGKIVRQMLRKLFVSGVIILLSILLMQINPTFGIVVMMLYSTGMMIQASRQEMPLGKFTALLPGGMSFVSFLVLTGFCAIDRPLMPLVGLGLGILPGWLMARSHRIYRKNGRLYAKRTFFYMIIWGCSLLFTQGSAILNLRRTIMDFGFLLNGFSTAMMLVLSILLFIKTIKNKTPISPRHTSLGILFPLFILSLSPFFICPQVHAAKQTIICAPKDEICCFSHAFVEGGPVLFEQCVAQGMSFEVDVEESDTLSQHQHDSQANDAAAAGLVIAFIQFLTALGLSTATAAAQVAASAAASAVADAGLETANNTENITAENDNTILDGDDAVIWMKENGYFDENGAPTSKYHDFLNSPYSQTDTGLQGFAGDTDENGNPTGTFSIIVDTDNSDTIREQQQEPAESEESEQQPQSESTKSEEPEQQQAEPAKQEKPEQEVQPEEPGQQQQPETTKSEEPDRTTSSVPPVEPNTTKNSTDTATDKKDHTTQTTKDKQEKAPGYLSQLGSNLYKDLSSFGLALYENVKYSLTDTDYLAEAVIGTAKDGLEAAETLGNLLNGKTIIDAGTKLAEEIKKNPDIFSDAAESIKELGRDALDFAEDTKATLQFVSSGFQDGPGQSLEENMHIADDMLTGMQEDVSNVVTGIKNYLSDPDKVYEGIKTVTGVKNFENSWDPDRSVNERLTEVAFGVINLADTLSGAEAIGNIATTGTRRILNTAGSSAADLLDDVASKAATVLRDKTDDGIRLATKSAEIADDVKDTGTILNKVTDVAEHKADDFSKISRPNRTDYAEYIENRGQTKGSSIAHGSPDDFIPAEHITPDTSGYTRTSQKHLQITADKYGVQIHSRPTNSAAQALIEHGEALPKPQLLKNKTIGEIDTYIGFAAEDIGKVGHGLPTAPDWNNIPQEKWHSVMERYVARKQEFADQAQWLASHSDQVKIHGNLIIDIKTNKPFTGDVDLFDIRGTHGEPLPASVSAQINKELKEGMPGITEELAGAPHKGHANVQHGRHVDWDYSTYDRARPTTGEGQSKFEIAQSIDKKIRQSHAPGGEALVTYSPALNQPPGTSPNPTASYWKGGDNNPFIQSSDS